MKQLPRILGMMTNPLAISSARLTTIMQVIRDHVEDLVVDRSTIKADQPGRSQTGAKPYQITSEGTAVIPVQGVLCKRSLFGAEIDAVCGIGSYASISAAFNSALADSMVRGILLDIDSPGGEVVGLFELADQIFAARGKKPIFAIANDLAASAAYAIASAADRVYVTRMGAVGSVGVVCCHVDESGYDRKTGFSYEFVFAGARKIDGNAHEPLSNPARESLQAEVDRVYGTFAGTVARHRGMRVDAVEAMEAGIYYAESAVPVLAEGVTDFAGALKALEDGYQQQSQKGSKANSVRQNAIRIANYCKIAGRTDLIVGFLKSGKSSDQVMKELSQMGLYSGDSAGMEYVN